MTYRSETYKVRVGCGNLYITVDWNGDTSPHKIRIQRNSKFRCSLITRDHLAKQATFQIRRDPGQLIKDLSTEGTPCEMYNVSVKSEIMKGGLGGYSCGDAIAQVVKMLLHIQKMDTPSGTALSGV